MFANCRLGAVCHYVNDVDRTETFYRDVLGLTVQRIDDGHGNSMVDGDDGQRRGTALHQAGVAAG